jgi:hypothetical protein
LPQLPFSQQKDKTPAAPRKAPPTAAWPELEVGLVKSQNNPNTILGPAMERKTSKTILIEDRIVGFFSIRMSENILLFGYSKLYLKWKMSNQLKIVYIYISSKLCY